MTETVVDSRLSILAQAVEECIERGNFVLGSGRSSNYKVAMDKLSPESLDLFAEVIAEDIGDEDPDYVFGIPNGGIPIAERISELVDATLIDVDKEGNVLTSISNGNAYGVEDVITSGGSTLSTVEHLFLYSNSQNTRLGVPRVYACVQRTDDDPESRLRYHGIELRSMLIASENGIFPNYKWISRR